MKHQFDTENAKKYGLKEAILIEFFKHHISKNHPDIKEHKGRKYFKVSGPSLYNCFYFLSRRTVERTLVNLILKEVLVRENLNNNSFEKQLWYAFKNECKFLD